MEKKGSESALIFMGTGCSSCVPSGRCLIQPTDPPCPVCSQSLRIPPHLNPNYRCNTSLLIDYCGTNGEHSYILIDVGKTFREQVLRWFTFHRIPRIDSVLLTHEHADAVLGLDDLHSVQGCSSTDDKSPTPIYATQECMDSVVSRFPYLSNKVDEQGQLIRPAAQVDWKIIEENCEKPFIASEYVISRSGGGELDLLILDSNSIILTGSRNTHLCFPETLDAVKRIRPKHALLTGLTHSYDHLKVNAYLREWSEREGVQVQLAHDGLRVPIEL